MKPITISFKVLPGGIAGKAEVYAAVDRAIEVIRQSGLQYEVSASETTIEGPYDEVMAAIKRAQEAVLDVAPRVFTFIAIDWDPQGSSIDAKMAKYR
jgi:uncharacterized protein YqgV (UPF0045/DUF77 family)